MNQDPKHNPASETKPVDEQYRVLVIDDEPSICWAFETLFASYIAALERYGVKINKYNVTADKERGAPIANSKMIANLVEIDLVGRYDVYAEIRRVFVEESRQVIVVEEIMSARPDSLELDISAKMIVPTKGKDGGKDSE